jgi:EamA domain-containing membrane protein RarD
LGLIYALGAYLSWGLVVPVHFRLLDAVPAPSILAHRIVWSSAGASATRSRWCGGTGSSSSRRG